MAVAGTWTGKVYLPRRRQALPGYFNRSCRGSAYCASLQPSALSSCFRGIAISGIRTASRSSYVRRRGSVGGLVLATLESSTSILLVQEVEFIWNGQDSEVLLTGDFLNWETKLVLEKSSNGVFSLKQKLPVGRYSYKFIVDGVWKHSPDSPLVPDGTGGFNNEIIVTDAKDSADAPEKPVAKTEPTKESDIAKGKGQPAVSSSPKPVAKVAPKKVVAKSLEDTMLEDVIPLLTTTLRKEEGIADLDITFEDNQLKTSFSKGDVPYCFWAFFPDGIIEGSRGSSLTSYGSPPSTIEPFLVDEKKITPELLVFWIRKRLFAQNILSLN